MQEETLTMPTLLVFGAEGPFQRKKDNNDEVLVEKRH